MFAHAHHWSFRSAPAPPDGFGGNNFCWLRLLEKALGSELANAAEQTAVGFHGDHRPFGLDANFRMGGQRLKDARIRFGTLLPIGVDVLEVCIDFPNILRIHAML